MPRMEILDKNSINEFQRPPVLTSIQRKKCFDFSNKLIFFATKLRGPCNQIGFLLSWGYFKISKRFYAAVDFHIRDITYVARWLNYDAQAFHSSGYKVRTRQRHQLQIIKLFGFRKFDDIYEKRLNGEIAIMVKQHLKPKLIFWYCVELMITDKVTFPSYFRVQELILSNIAHYKSAMNLIIEQTITKECRAILNSLFTQVSEFQQYRLTLLKKPSQATNPFKIKYRLSDLILLKELHNHILPILKELGLTTEGIRYFAVNVIKTKTSHLLRKEQVNIDLHLIAFIAHQYYCLQDNLIDVFLSAVKNTENAASREHRDWCFENRKKVNNVLVERIERLKLDISGTFQAALLQI